MLITDTASLKNSIRDHEVEKAKLAKQIEEKNNQIAEFESRLNDKVSLDNDLRLAVEKNKENDVLIKKLQEENDELRRELATLEIKLTDQEKDKIEENHKRIIGDQAEKYKAKLADILTEVQKQLDTKDNEIKKVEQEKNEAQAKADTYKNKLAEL